MMRRAFTLLELLVVMSIMGIMATASAVSYRTMRRGLEESSVVRNASQFVHLAYQRSQIDRVPVNLYFWNETSSIEDETKGTKTVVAGRAVAVRRNGRLSAVDGQKLVDEYGDLQVYAATDEEGDIDENSSKYQNDVTMYLYKVNGNESTFQRSKVSQTTAPYPITDVKMMSDIEQTSESGGTGGDASALGSSTVKNDDKKILAYAFYVQNNGGVTWYKGDAYGLEFADFGLPNNYIFGNNYSTSVDNPVREVKVINFDPLSGSASGKVAIGALRPNSQGELTVKSLGETAAADSY